MSEAGPPEGRDERYARQTKEHFELLGRFVQAFELVVHEVRMGCQQLTTRTPADQRLMRVVFHHYALSAQPLFDIFRALVAEFLADLNPAAPDPGLRKEREAALGVLKQVATAYQALISKRNVMLHGTWHIGWANPADNDFSELRLSKFEATKTGFAAADTPKDAEELRSLIADCERLEHLVRTLTLCIVVFGEPRVTANFFCVGGVWATSVQRG